jgi:Low molecular weight phosphotyrosine protein phosphatase
VTESPRLAINFVCMGHICRSPAAEAVMRQLLREAELQHTINSRGEVAVQDLAEEGLRGLRDWLIRVPPVGQTAERRVNAYGDCGTG